MTEWRDPMQMVVAEYEARLAALRTEVEFWRGEHGRLYQAGQRLRAEVERLNAALRSVMDSIHEFEAFDIARRALRERPFYECPDCGSDIANSTHAALCPRNRGDEA
jgi:uncharacterized small protein (DUF1192 family)